MKSAHVAYAQEMDLVSLTRVQTQPREIDPRVDSCWLTPLMQLPRSDLMMTPSRAYATAWQCEKLTLALTPRAQTQSDTRLPDYMSRG